MKLIQKVLLAGILSATAVFADAKAIATEEIGKQYALLKKGHTAKLREHFTERQ